MEFSRYDYRRVLQSGALFFVSGLNFTFGKTYDKIALQVDKLLRFDYNYKFTQYKEAEICLQ